MKNLRRSFHIFCYRNRNKGIPNLMLYVVLGCAIVYVMGMFDNTNALYYMLCFDKQAILQGQIWRLFTYAFLYSGGNPLFTALVLYILYSIGRATELTVGTLRFNLFIFSGIILQDIFCMILGTPATAIYLYSSVTLVLATSHPDLQFRLYFFIPIKAWLLGLIDIGIIAYNVFALRAIFPHNLFPLVSLLNALIFFGENAKNLLPMSLRLKLDRHSREKAAKKTGVIYFDPVPYRKDPDQKNKPYTHRCTVCGRTDVSNPELEFRYCSRCNGYHCYCEEHINNHEHIE